MTLADHKPGDYLLIPKAIRVAERRVNTTEYSFNNLAVIRLDQEKRLLGLHVVLCTNESGGTLWVRSDCEAQEVDSFRHAEKIIRESPEPIIGTIEVTEDEAQAFDLIARRISGGPVSYRGDIGSLWEKTHQLLSAAGIPEFSESSDNFLYPTNSGGLRFKDTK